jgi:hypothetical protein
MGKYKVRVRYTFNVDYTFDGPKSLEEAKEWAEDHVAMSSAGLTTSLPDYECDWSNDVYGNKTIVRVIKEK